MTPLLRTGDTPAEALASLCGQECPQLKECPQLGRRDKSGYATILTGSKLQWGLQSPSEAKTQLKQLCQIYCTITLKYTVLECPQIIYFFPSSSTTL
jgi:hypothetical protein